MLWFSFKNNFSLRSCFHIPIAFKCQNRLKICKQLLMVSWGHFRAKKKKKAFKLNSATLPGNGKYASCSVLAINTAPRLDFIWLREPTQAWRRPGLTVRGDVKAWAERGEPTGSSWEQPAGQGSVGLGWQLGYLHLNLGFREATRGGNIRTFVSRVFWNHTKARQQKSPFLPSKADSVLCQCSGTEVLLEALRSVSIIFVSPSCSPLWQSSERVEQCLVGGWDKRQSHALKHINCLLITPLITVTPLSAFPVAWLLLGGTVTWLCLHRASFAALFQNLLAPEGWKQNQENT